ncbi:TetR/AcrR family transcriptional regulator [Amycolatopsis sp. YIM 10]|uniref:TetR/AcrR family transcriptional regulator n=1 Tax=Amycolatopsis sp. YIM 10 TaxID=2653857 RepID=UPI0012A8A3D6|nr:TetR/AcrR family transcriptional regulator [Amycolatopsis sp. YIM 10]QFU92492.1 HTH-type transcriptional repressor KstR [Amycolatopsis sp. YIM 10]
MARIAEARPPAEPASKGQAARRERILESAAELGARSGFDRMQMHDVAKDAGVAIATLYRYFPSKTHLFARVYETQVRRFVRDEWRRDETDPVRAVGESLVALNRKLLRRPLLCAAMVQAATTTYTAAQTEATETANLADSVLVREILHAAGDARADSEAAAAVRLLVYSWWGVLVSALSHKMSEEQAEAEVRLAARLLLAPSSR